ncbi:MAG: hypothetical protein RM022_009255 [Nostoc sp. EfeVER01]|uniref:hypothetical protein n=1 Tax=unclassified Nostoc TaxID=2593658 RepID=UPI002AD47D91
MYLHIIKKRSLLFIFLFILLLTLLLALPWVSAKEPPQPEAWQINGIVAALDDGYDQVKGSAFNKLVGASTFGRNTQIASKPFR